MVYGRKPSQSQPTSQAVLGPTATAISARVEAIRAYQSKVKLPYGKRTRSLRPSGSKLADDLPSSASKRSSVRGFVGAARTGARAGDSGRGASAIGDGVEFAAPGAVAGGRAGAARSGSAAPWVAVVSLNGLSGSADVFVETMAAQPVPKPTTTVAKPTKNMRMCDRSIKFPFLWVCEHTNDGDPHL
jgi:hypothetical protein